MLSRWGPRRERGKSTRTGSLKHQEEALPRDYGVLLPTEQGLNVEWNGTSVSDLCM